MPDYVKKKRGPLPQGRLTHNHYPVVEKTVKRQRLRLMYLLVVKNFEGFFAIVFCSSIHPGEVAIYNKAQRMKMIINKL